MNEMELVDNTTTIELSNARLIYRPVAFTTIERGETYAFTALWEQTNVATQRLSVIDT
jgi:hypothetical protein